MLFLKPEVLEHHQGVLFFEGLLLSCVD